MTTWVLLQSHQKYHMRLTCERKQRKLIQFQSCASLISQIFRNMPQQPGELLWKMRQTFTSQIKASNLADVFISPYFLENNLVAPRENPPLTHFGAINLGRNISNTFSFSLSGPIKQIWYTDVKSKTKIVLLMDFFILAILFE